MIVDTIVENRMNESIIWVVMASNFSHFPPPLSPGAMQSPSDHHDGAADPPADPDGSPRWASALLYDCARAIAGKDSSTAHHLLWALNELSSPYGDLEQRLAAHFLQALFCRATASGGARHRSLSLAAEHARSFDAARALTLRFQELCPLATFGHVASNAAILDAVAGESRVHIVDIGGTYCTQWPTLLEALASRAEDPPAVRLTAVALAPAGAAVMREVGRRMERFARLMGVPLRFEAVSGLARLGELDRTHLQAREGEALAVSCTGALRRVEPAGRDRFLRMLAALGPRVVTVVEEEADLTCTSGDFMRCFGECLRFYTLVFSMLEETLGATSSERLAVERECARGIVGVLACNDNGGDDDNPTADSGDCERRERGSQWHRRLAGIFAPASLGADAVGDIIDLLKRYRGDWSVAAEEGGGGGLYLKWKEEAIVWASAWRV